MKITTFYYIYYQHRFKKAKNIRKIYLFFTLVIRYFYIKIFIEKKIYLEKLEKTKNYLFNKDLNYLFEFFNSDKGFFFLNQYSKSREKNKINGHEYSIHYNKYFMPIKNQKLNILELGCFKGGASAALHFFFKNGKIFSGDLFPDLRVYYSNRIKVFKIDTSSEKSISKFLSENKIQFDIVIEDASHYLKDQIISLFMIFEALKPGGLFVIEELDFPDTRNDMNTENDKNTLRKILLDIKKKKDFKSKYVDEFQKKYFLKNFEFINIYKGRTNEIAFIKKK